MSTNGPVPAPPGDLAAWRRDLRRTLLDRRLAAGAAQRQCWAQSILASLQALLGRPDGRVLGFCWPYQGEADVTPVVRRWIEGGGIAALPVVLRPRQPMVFRRWDPSAAMTRGVYDIPIPADAPEVLPQLLLVPLTGFDEAGYRLGYGGGFFDRTVAEMRPRPQLIGVGFELSRIDSIHPQAHDVPMDLIVTERGVVPRGAGHDAPAIPIANSIAESASGRTPNKTG